MTKSLVFFFFMCAATISEALEVAARSGEHEGFTRVVFYLPEKVSWTSKHIANGIELSFSGHPVKFDADGFYKRLNQGRVKNIFVTPDGRKIVLEFGCRCNADQFSTEDGLLVYDIKRDSENRPLDTQTSKSKLPLFFRKLSNMPLQVDSSFEDEPRVDLQKKSGVNYIHALLFDALTAASDTNILEKTHPANVVVPPVIENVALEPENLSIRDGFDSAHLTIDRSPPLTQNGESCPTNIELNLFEWAGKVPFNEQMALARSRLVGEFDDIDKEAVESLVKLYLAFGFGAEARQTIEAFKTKRDHKTFLAMADILENRKQEASSFFQKFASCNTHAAMWSILGQGALPQRSGLNVDAITFATMSLPPALKPQLGVLVAERVFEAGYSDLSEILLGHIEQTNSGRSFNQGLIFAKLKINAGQKEEAAVLLEKLLNSDTLIAPDALIELIDLKILLDQPFDQKLAEMAGLLAWQHKDENIGQRLLQYQIKALVMEGAFRQALKKYRASPKTSDFNSDFAQLITSKAPDFAFLEAAFSIGFPISDPSLTAMAMRLFKLEFWQQAEIIMNQRGSLPITKQLKNVKAEIALKRHKPRKALVILQGLSDQSALRVKAQALMDISQFDTAEQVFANLNDRKGQTIAAWHGQNRVALKKLGNPELAAFLDLGSHSFDESMPLLARNRLLIESSQHVRSTLKATLAAVQNIVK